MVDEDEGSCLRKQVNRDEPGKIESSADAFQVRHHLTSFPPPKKTATNGLDIQAFKTQPMAESETGACSDQQAFGHILMEGSSCAE
jgi:hypothetical protein